MDDLFTIEMLVERIEEIKRDLIKLESFHKKQWGMINIVEKTLRLNKQIYELWTRKQYI